MGTKEERAAKAAANYAQNRPVEAALGFEGLWKDFPDEVDYLFNAAASRVAAGHYAHAVAYTRDLLATSGLAEDARKEAEAQLREALTHTSTVNVMVTVEAREAGPEVTIITKYLPRESGDVRPELLFTAETTNSLQLDPGVWVVKAQGPGLVTTEQRVGVVAGKAIDVSLTLKAAPKEPPPHIDDPKTPRQVPSAVIRKQLLGFGVAGGVVAVVGVGLIAAGSVRIGNAEVCPSTPIQPCRDALATAVSMRAVGTLSFGGGVGLIAGSLPWLAKDAKIRQKVWIAETVVGVVAFAGGMALATVAGNGFQEATYSPTLDSAGWPEHYQNNARVPLHGVGNALMGFGAGAVVSSVTGMLVQRKHLRNIGANASFGRGQAGLMLYGRF